MRETWDEYFMGMARRASSRSKDRSTKVGAVCVGPDREIRLTAYNGMVRGVNDDVEERHQRPEKYLWMAHGEENIVATAARIGLPLKGCSIYVVCEPEPLPPCASCARMMIQAGIVKVVYERAKQPDNPETLARWNESTRVALEMLKEAGVEVVVLEKLKKENP